VIEQQARVVTVEQGRVQVRIGGQTGCSACDDGKGCGAGLFGKLLKRHPVEMELDNSIGAINGQAVLLGMSEALFLKLVFRLYGLPLLAGLLGAVGGHWLAVNMGAGAGMIDLLTLAVAVFAALTVLIFRQRASRQDISSKEIHLLERPVANSICGRGVPANQI